MAENTVDIEVHLKGTEAAKKGLSSLGESAGKIGEKFDKTNSHLGEGLSQITDNVADLGGSFKDLGSTLGSLGKAGGATFASLIPAMAGVVAAAFAVYEAFNMITGASQRAEDASEAAAAAASDLTSKLEALAEKGVTPTARQLIAFAKVTLRTQIAKEKLQKVMENAKEVHEEYVTALQDSTNADKKFADIKKRQIALNKQFAESTTVNIDLFKQQLALDRERGAVLEPLRRQNRKFNQFIVNKVVPAQLKVNQAISEGAAIEKQLDDQSKEAILTRVKELQTKLFALKLADEESKQTGHALELQKTYIEQEKEALSATIDSNKENAKALAQMEKDLKAKVELFNEEEVMNAKFEAQRREIHYKINEEIDKADAAARAKRLAQIKAQQAKEDQLRRQQIAEAFQIRLLEIKQMELQGATAEQIAQARYEAELDLAKGNSNKLLMVGLRYENQRLTLQAKADAKAEQERQRQEEHRRNFILESQAFDISMMEEGVDKELSELDLKYRREIEMKQRSEEEKTELTRRYNVERAHIEEKAVNAQIDRIGEVTDHLGSGLASAAYSALVFGESFQESAARVIGGLGEQAAVEALISTAKGIAASVLNPAAASAHFAAAAQFGVAAAVAGVASAGLSGGGGGGGASAVSPTGSPQIAPTPEREQAESSSMVFNINFGGAVIYDSKQAAEQAMADRITRLQNVQRRGAPRRRS